MSEQVFLVALAVVAFAYLGYPALVVALARGRRRLPRAGLDAPAPAITVVLAARDEAARIEARLANLLASDYPPERLRVIVADDGSRDATAALARAHDPRVRVVSLSESRGKAAALDAARAQVTTPIVVFADARQRFAPDALRRLVAPFADPEVGCVTGELMFADDPGAAEPTARRLGLYWRYEKAIREAEATLGIAHGATGAIYAVRREHFAPLPEGLILDDMHTPLMAVRAGRRIAVARDAVAYDVAPAKTAHEFRRKLRTLAGNWQLIRVLPWLLDPRRPVFLAFLSHKLLRLLVPWCLIAMLVASALGDAPWLRVAFLAQLVFYVVAALAALRPAVARLPGASIAGTFVVLNLAALLSLPACALGDARVLWRRS